MAKKQWTRDSALAFVRTKGANINQDKKQIFIEPTPEVGNGTRGALDYLKYQQKFVVIFGREEA